VKFLRTLTFGLLICAIVYSLVRPRGGPEEGQTAPRFRGQMLSGETFDLDEHRGEVVVLDFWATWCGPCRRSLPALDKVHRGIGQASDVTILSINQDRVAKQGALVKGYLKERRLRFPVLLDRGNVAAIYRVTTLPTMVIIGPDGVVNEVNIGLQSSDTDRLARELEEQISALRSKAQ